MDVVKNLYCVFPGSQPKCLFKELKVLFPYYFGTYLVGVTLLKCKCIYADGAMEELPFGPFR